MKQYVAFGIEILCVHLYWSIWLSFYQRLDIYHRTSETISCLFITLINVMSTHNESTIIIKKQLN